jgi:hypothetical protein
LTGFVEAFADGWVGLDRDLERTRAEACCVRPDPFGGIGMAGGQVARGEAQAGVAHDG